VPTIYFSRNLSTSRQTKASVRKAPSQQALVGLKPWTDFPILLQQLFERVSELIPEDAKHFSSTQYLTELGQDLCDRPLASEKDLETYQRLAVERPTTNIISQHQQIEVARLKFNLGSSIIFENHANNLSDSNKEV